MMRTKYTIIFILILIVSIQAVQANDRSTNISHNYSQNIAAANTTVNVFYSSHCSSCSRVMPLIENLSESYPEIEVRYYDLYNSTENLTLMYEFGIRYNMHYVSYPILFTGDTIMVSSIGRPDLGGMVRQWAHLLYDTLFHRYEALADDTVILPSHIAGLKDAGRNGVAQLTLGSARAARELFHITDEPAFITRIEESLLENPARYQDIRKVNLGLIDPDETRRKELEIGKNLCGMAGKKAA